MNLFGVPELSPCEFLDVKVVGRGSFGQIHAMLHTSSGDVVAIKRMSKRACLARPSHLKALSTELSILSKINSRFLLRLESIIHTPDELCFVLPYFPGGDLTRHFESIDSRFGSVNPSWIEFYASEVVLALADLHALKVVHRDVKPENLLVTRDGHLVLCDFGIAHQLLPKDRYKTKGRIGNGPFVAPEIASGKGWYDCDADLYSLGVLLIWMFERHANVPRFQAKLNNAKTPLVARALIDKLVERDYHRLSMKQVQSHAFFANTDWEALKLGHISPPIDAEIKSWHQNPYLVALNSDQTALPDFIGYPEKSVLSQCLSIDSFGLLDNKQGSAQLQPKVELREAPLTEQQQDAFLRAISSVPSAPTLLRCVSDNTSVSSHSLVHTPNLSAPCDSNMSTRSELSSVSTPSGLSELALSFPEKSGDVMFSSNLSTSSDGLSCSQPTPRRFPVRFRYPIWRGPPSRSPSPPRDFDDPMCF